VEKGLPLLLTGFLIVPRRLIQCLQELFSAFLSCTPAKHFIEKHLHRLIVRDGKSVTMYHKKLPPSDGYPAQAGAYFRHSSISSLSATQQRCSKQTVAYRDHRMTPIFAFALYGDPGGIAI